MSIATTETTPGTTTGATPGAPIGAPVRYRRGASIRSAAVADSIVLLDLDRANYSLLNPAAAVIWQAIERPQTMASLTCDVHRRVGGDRAQVEDEVRQFLDDGQVRGIVGTGPIPVPAPMRLGAPGRFRLLLLKAFLATLWTRIELRFASFGRIYARLSHFRACDDRSGGSLPIAERAFLTVESWFPVPSRRTDCLPRSIALFRFLRSVGLPARHFIGVRHTPLLMHAWVECGDRVVLDDGHAGAMSVLAQLG